MKILYVTEQGSIIKKTSRRLIITKEGKIIAEVSTIGLEGIVIFGNIQITTPVIATLLESGIYVSFLSYKGKFRGILLPVQHKNVFLRIAQYERYLDDEFQRKLASKIVKAKITNAKKLILKYSRNHPEIDFNNEILLMDKSFEKVERTPPVPVLLGIEGQATTAYFRAFRKMIQSDIIFSGRNRRPPKDPVNVMLSFGYTILTNEILSLLFATGFDPYIGYLHGIDYGRPSLALDIIEEFRHPIIDRLVLHLLNRKIFTVDDFIEEKENGVILNKDAIKKFIHHYENLMTDQTYDSETGQTITYRNLIRQQIYKMAKTIQTGQHYNPFIFE